MGVLRNLENRIAGAVEGTFSRVFRSQVRPLEIARRLAREMDEHQAESLSHVYVPNEYRVYLSPRDHDRFLDYEEQLAEELASYLLEHARRERLTLLSAPVIEFETDPRLGLGQFGIETSVVQSDEEERPAGVLAARAPGNRTMVHNAPARVAAPPSGSNVEREQRAVLVHAGRRLAVGAAGATIGRSRECEVVVNDPNVSRRHAEVRLGHDGWMIVDLNSTNGSRLNGELITGAVMLHPGDRIEVGSAAIGFELD